MTRSEHILNSLGAQFIVGAVLAAAWLLFATVHVVIFVQTGAPSLLIFCTAETIIAGFLLFRTPARSFSQQPHEWLIAALGTFLPLLLRPTSVVLVSGAEWAISIGAALQILGVLSLNRSFAIVPALREVKTRGMYRWVRHPIYASYLITLSGYLLGNYSARNAVTWLLTISFLLLRIHLEERHLSRSSEYRSYMKQVRWRVLPLIF